MSSILSIVVPGLPPSPNDRLHWAQLAKQRSITKEATQYLAREAKRQAAWALADRAALAFTFVFPTARRRDPDNLLASVKPLIDGLVAERVIADDSFDVITSLKVAAIVRPEVRSPEIIVHVYREERE